METDFTLYFEQYKAVSKMADEVFERVQKEHPKEVTCEIKCADCCHALFDLTLIEALYLNHKFNQKFQGKEREQLIANANRADRKVYMIKRKAYQEMQSGKKEVEILVELSAERCTIRLRRGPTVSDG